MRAAGDDLLMIALLLVACVACLFVGDIIAGTKFRREAVKAGVAEWRSDERGQPVFTWKTRVRDE